MKYDLEESFIGSIRDDIPKLASIDQMRTLVVEGDAADEDDCASLTFAQRINDKIHIKWIEGEDGDQKYTADLWPKNRDDDSDLDYWEWEGSLHCSFIRDDAGWHADQIKPDTDSGSVTGWMFEDSEGSCFVGRFAWKSGETERVVIHLFEG